MFVRDSIYQNLIELVKNDDSAGLKFFLRWERDRRSYLHHRNNDGLTLLHQACLLGKRNVVHALVECGCDIEGRSSVGWTALHAGALSGCFDVVSYLVNSCASNVLAVDDMGCKPIDLTLEPRISKLLKESTEKTEQKTAEHTKFFNDAMRRELSKIICITKARSNTCPSNGNTRSSPLAVTRVKSDTNVLKRVRFGRKNEDTKSLPGDIAKVRDQNNNGISKHSQDASHRDSGIYEDFLEMREISTIAHASKKQQQQQLQRTTIMGSKSTTV